LPAVFIPATAMEALHGAFQHSDRLVVGEFPSVSHRIESVD